MSERMPDSNEFTWAILSIARSVTIRNGEEWKPEDQIRQMIEARDAVIEELAYKAAMASIPDGGASCKLCIAAIRKECADREAQLLDAAKAFQELATCYRIGKRPTEKLFARLEKANAAIMEDDNETGN